MNLADYLASVAAKCPNTTALITHDRTVSYEELDRAATRIAQRLLNGSCRPGDRVAIHWSNSVEAVTLYFACFRAGLIAVPVNTRLKPPEIAYVLEHSEAALCFSQPELAPAAEVAIREKPELRGFYTSLRSLENPETGEISLPVVRGNDPAIIIYTSGTTARPKGVTHSHAALFEGVAAAGAVAGHPQTVLLTTSMMHYSGLACMLMALLGGGSVVIMPGFDAAVALDSIERFQCDTMFCLPTFVQLLIREQELRPRNVISLRNCLAGGDSVPLHVQQRFRALFHAPLREVYAMTETAVTIANSCRTIVPGSIGTPVDGVEVRLVDVNGDDVPAGETGEIMVRGPANCLGYWNDPGATSHALCDGWLSTGDLARQDKHGYYWFEGRRKEIIIRGGSNIAPREVEGAMCDHPGVLEVAVVGVPDPIHGERVVAFIAPRAGSAVKEEELRIHTRRGLADYKVPETIISVPSLPKNSTGKIDRRLLKETYLAGKGGQIGAIRGIT